MATVAIRKDAREILIEALGGICKRCGSTLEVELHHKIPLSRGGPDSFDNLEPACRECHMGIHLKDHQELLIERQRTGRMRIPITISFTEKDWEILDKTRQEALKTHSSNFSGVVMDALRLYFQDVGEQ